MARQNRVLLGHEAAVNFFMQAAQTRLHHAWLLHGARGIGKTSFAYHCATYLLSNGQQQLGALRADEKTYQLIAAGAHPDIHLVSVPIDEKTGNEKNEIPVAAVRELGAFFKKTAGHGGWRVAIIRGADGLNRNAANALLKVLEEPPQRSILFLTAEVRGKLLPTLRSRCRPLAFNPPPATVLTEILHQHEASLTTAQIQLLHRLASGSPGVALRLLQQQGLVVYQEFLALLATPPAQATSAILRFVGGSKIDKERFDLVMRFAQQWLAQLARFLAIAATDDLPNHEAGLLHQFAARRGLPQWLVIMDELAVKRTLAEQGNLDYRLMMIDAMHLLING